MTQITNLSIIISKRRVELIVVLITIYILPHLLLFFLCALRIKSHLFYFGKISTRTARQSADGYIHASLDIQTVKIRKRNMTDKQLDTKLVNAGRSKKYTLSAQ